MNEALLRSAYGLQQAGKVKEAAKLYGEILRANPKHFEALYYLAYLHFESGRFATAERLFEEAAKVDPASADAHFARGCALQRLNRHDAAVQAYDTVLSLEPRHADALVNRGIALMDLDQRNEALLIFDKALAIDPGHVEGLCNKGVALIELKRHGEALTILDQALKLAPGHVKARINRANVLKGLGRGEDALADYAKALSIEPNNADALANRAHTLFELRRFEESASDYEKVLNLDPDRKYAWGFFLMSRNQCCDWRDLDDSRSKIASLVKAGKRAVVPWACLGFSGSPEEQWRCARIYAEAEFPRQPPLWRGERYEHRRIRIAYVSGDFRLHPMPHLMAGIFERHDKSRFETMAISFGADDKSEIRKRVTGAFEHFTDVQTKSDTDIAQLMREREVDIAIDLAGYTGTCRTGIFAARPAPVQVSHLGFPGTMGSECIDYIIADRIVIPDASQRFFTEKIVYLPDTYWPTDTALKVAEPIPERHEAGLPPTGFVFASFNNSFKITPDVFSVWMRLLRAVEGSVLWLLEDNAGASRNVRREAAARGITPERLIFAPRRPMQEHLARQRLADLFLDTLPCNAHTTASDCLWVGVPLVTCHGEAFAGRVAASVLEAAGVPELVTRSLDEYEALALRLVRGPCELGALKAKLARNRGLCPLFDTTRFTRHLEAAYVMMWERARRGLPPETFAVSAS